MAVISCVLSRATSRTFALMASVADAAEWAKTLAAGSQNTPLAMA